MLTAYSSATVLLFSFCENVRLSIESRTNLLSCRYDSLFIFDHKDSRDDRDVVDDLDRL